MAGACGFILSTFLHRLINEEPQSEFIVYDNLSSGKLEFLDDIKDNPRLKIIIGDVKDLPKLTESMKSCDIVFHFCSNADISAAVNNPTIDFYEGALLTQNILEAMRLNGIKKIVYASGSGVFGETHGRTATENYHPMIPSSTYGASKLYGEALISAYCNMFDFNGKVYRFANVVGRFQTHGCGFDFIKKLKNNPKELQILGNGRQIKGYIYVDDVIDGILATYNSKNQYDYFNLAPKARITVKEIADIAAEEMGLSNVEYKYSGDISWRGDVKDIKMSAGRAKKYGWNPKYTTQEAVRKSIREMLGKE
jgi:UDP-glucose 4-epimerase